MKKEKETAKAKKGTLSKIFAFAKPNIGSLILAFVFSAVAVAGTLLTPVIIGRAVDSVFGAGDVDFSVIFTCSIQLGAVIAVVFVCKWLSEIATNNVSYKIVSTLRQDLFRKINHMPLKTLDNIPSGELTSRVIFDTDKISDGLIQGATQAISGILTILGTLVFMLTINVWIALLVVLLTPVSLFVSSRIAKNTHHLFKKQSRIIGEIASLSTEYISANKTVKAFSAEDIAKNKFQILNAQLTKVGDKAMFVSSLVNPTTRFINGVIYAFVCVLGAFLTIKYNSMTIGELTCALAYANHYTKPFNEITGVVTELQSAFAASRRVFELLEIKDEPAVTTLKRLPLPQEFDKIEFNNVSFSYNKEKPLINNLSLTIKAGSKVAIVGPTGAGKTTLINLLLRFYELDSGEIKLGDTPINAIDKDELRSVFGLVLQDTWVFNGTYLDNIAFGVDDASEQDVENAAKKCHLNDFISRKEGGYHHNISEGSSISAGQIQLLTIARAWLKNPKILVLDEATSSVDTRTEKNIVKAMNELTSNRTSFVIAHRLSTIKDADLILVMKDGDVIEQGTHDGLMSENTFYKRLYNSQFS